MTLGRSWRSSALWVADEDGFDWLWGGLGSLERPLRDMFGNLVELWGVILAPKIAAEFGKYSKKCGSKRQAVPQRFFSWIFSRRQAAQETPRPDLSLRILQMHIGVLTTDTEFCSCWMPTWHHVGFQNWKIRVQTMSGRLLGAGRGLQDGIWCFQRGLGKLQKVLEAVP